MVNEKDLKKLNVVGAKCWSGIMGWKAARKPKRVNICNALKTMTIRVCGT